MVRPEIDKKQKRILKEIPYHQWWAMLDKAMRETGMYSHIIATPSLKDMLDRTEAKVIEDYPGVVQKNRDLFLYRSRVTVARHILKEDNNALVKWTSKDQRRFWNINIVKENFLKYGPDSLPAHYKHASKHGGVFKWSPTANINVICLLRGTGKSHTDVAVRSLHDFINNPSYKALIGHSEESKAAELIKRISDALFHPNLMVAFPEFFVDDVDMYRARGTEIKKDSVNMRVVDFNDMFRVMDPTDYMRGEKTFNLFTPNIDPTGQHVNIIKIDDWVTQRTSETAEKQNKLIEVFNSFSGLEEYTYDENGKAIPIKIQVTDTAWWGPSLVTYILENKDCNAFICPMSFDDNEHADPFDHKYRIDPRVDNEFIRRKKDEFKEWFWSQCYMIERSRDEMLKFAGDKKEFVFAYHDEEDAPVDVERVPFTKLEITRNGANIISKDPSYQDKGKDMSSSVSKDTTIAGTFYKGTRYITGAIQEAGAPTQSRQIMPILDLDRHAKTDVLVIDSASYQFYIVEGIFDKLKTVNWAERYGIWYEYYKKSNQSKVQLANEVLGSMFSSGLIKVHWTLLGLIKEIMRDTQGFDYLDALIQLCSLDMIRLNGISMTKQYMNEGEKNKNLQPQGNSDILFRTTGY